MKFSRIFIKIGLFLISLSVFGFVFSGYVNAEKSDMTKVATQVENVGNIPLKKEDTQQSDVKKDEGDQKSEVKKDESWRNNVRYELIDNDKSSDSNEVTKTFRLYGIPKDVDVSVAWIRF